MIIRGFKFLLNTFIFVTILSFGFYAQKTFASTSDNVFGNAWSDHIGWISFNNCIDPNNGAGCGSVAYGVKVDKSTMQVSGQAWNDTVGWISFDPSQWGGKCSPSGASCSGFTNKWGPGGWARVTSAKIYDTDTDQNKTNSGNFDGWISLSGSSWGAPFDTSKNVSLSMPSQYNSNYIYTIDTSSSGYWWGSEVVGWIDMKPKSSPDPYTGGVFLMDLSTETLSLVSSQNTVVAGDTVDFTWDTNATFTPTSCTGTMFDEKDDPISGRGDWNKMFTNSGSKTKDIISGIQVPFDSNNTNNVKTKFVLSCTDGVKTVSQSAWVTAEPLTVFLRNSGGCVFGTTAVLAWDTNDSTQSCSIEATPASGGSSPYSITVSGTSPGQTDDNDFSANKGNGPTKYTMSCTNGIPISSGGFQAPASAMSTGTVSINQCTEDFTISQSPSCPQFAPVGAGYDATVELGVNPLYGFNDDVDISDGGGLGAMTFSPSTTFKYFSSGFSKINVTLSLSKTEYDSIDWKKRFFKDVNLSSVSLPTKTRAIEFCSNASAPKVKPKYVPF